jgi:hypothetical protein
MEISSPGGAKAIFPMNDIFLNFAFEAEENWGLLQDYVNDIITAYREVYPQTSLQPIEDEIKVRTQWKHLLDKNGQTNNQDIVIEETAKDTYVEFQIRAYPDIPLPTRAISYFGLGISRGKGREANQIWLLAEHIPELLGDSTFKRYILKAEDGDNIHPGTSGILYVSLQKLAQCKTKAGSAARVMLGKSSAEDKEIAKPLYEGLQRIFEKFKEQKELANMMTFAERWHAEGRAEGMEKGMVTGVQKLMELIKSGMSPDEAAQLVLAENTP